MALSKVANIGGNIIFPSFRPKRFLGALLFLGLLGGAGISPAYANDLYLKQVNGLHELWNFYKYTYIEKGRVISRDENDITTSEGQSYAMLRAVWINDHATFREVYDWTRTQLMVRGDHLFAWKWQHDRNSASDADTDIALALLLAWKKFSLPAYRDDALKILNDIWNKEVVQVHSKCFLTAGDWAVAEKHPAIHVGYLAPYAYEIFAQVDKRHPWQALVDSSYEILKWLYFTQRLVLPPQVIFLDKKSGQLFIKKAGDSRQDLFSYDAFPLYWRIAMDFQWHGRGEGKLRRAMLAFFQSEWRQKGKILDHYTPQGQAQSAFEALPLYATVHALALLEDRDLAQGIYQEKLIRLWEKALAGQETPYYLHNWLWFDRAFEVKVARNHLAFFDFFEPLDPKGFSQNFPWVLTLLTLTLYCLLYLRNDAFHRIVKRAFLVCAFAICLRYLWWRVNATLNFLEMLGPFISIALWTAEFYCLTTVALLLVQVGLAPNSRQETTKSSDFNPSVDVFIPIYSESQEILEKTLSAACALHYRNKTIFILDDSHREAVREIALAYGAQYLKGPRQHAKAGNLNNALALTGGELVAVFDTDHIPVSTFLAETVPFFSEPRVGVVQTPHHFYNQDIFQRAFRSSRRIPNEQDMFNHGIQGGRNTWQGAFFVGSGAVFRRKALQEIGGFKLMSITEDIHSSQHLHARGYTSVFVDQDLAVGLAAESYASYIVQRKRWMQGCLQVFFRNNPLFQKGLGLRHRLGYFASLYYFFFPVIRLIFWITPLYYLLFHQHPIFSDVSILLAYLVPNMICLPLLSAALLPRWPRLFWGVLYENAVSFPLLFSLFQMVLPRQLAFKVTPKGLLSDKRRFDFASGWTTLAAAAITLLAIIKGIAEYQYFGIEKDAYLFNLGWATYNLGHMLVGLLVAWERPQRRHEPRVTLPVPFKLKAQGSCLEGRLVDISLSGAAFIPAPRVRVPPLGTLELFEDQPLTIAVQRIYQDRRAFGRSRCGLKFSSLDATSRSELFLRTFACPQTWQDAHVVHTGSNLVMGCCLLRGVIQCFLPSVALRRSEIRDARIRFTRVFLNGVLMPAILRNSSEHGRRVLVFTPRVDSSGDDKILDGNRRPIPVRIVYTRKLLPYLHAAGLELCASS